MTHDPLEYVRQVHEEWLNRLEQLAIEAIAYDDWNAFYEHLIEFQSSTGLHGVCGVAIGTDGDAFTDVNLTPDTQCLNSTQTTIEAVTGEASADTLHGSSADLLSQTECYEPHEQGD